MARLKAARPRPKNCNSCLPSSGLSLGISLWFGALLRSKSAVRRLSSSTIHWCLFHFCVFIMAVLTWSVICRSMPACFTCAKRSSPCQWFYAAWSGSAIRVIWKKVLPLTLCACWARMMQVAFALTAKSFALRALATATCATAASTDSITTVLG